MFLDVCKYRWVFLDELSLWYLLPTNIVCFLGFNALECARLFHKLMFRLGYKKYYVAGGDWGALISGSLALLYPRLDFIKRQQLLLSVFFFNLLVLPVNHLVYRKKIILLCF